MPIRQSPADSAWCLTPSGVLITPTSPEPICAYEHAPPAAASAASTSSCLDMDPPLLAAEAGGDSQHHARYVVDAVDVDQPVAQRGVELDVTSDDQRGPDADARA